MTHPHLPPWTLDQMAEGTLSHAERTLAEAHLATCPACTAELDGARAVIAALDALPRYAPSPAFPELVMSRVDVRPVFAAAPARRWLPKTRKGWAGLWAVVLLPLIPLVPALAWLFATPGVTPGALWGLGRQWVAERAWSLVATVAETVLRSGPAQWIVTQGEALPGGYATLAVLAAVALLSIPVSGWVIVKILRAPTGGMQHA